MKAKKGKGKKKSVVKTPKTPKADTPTTEIPTTTTTTINTPTETPKTETTTTTTTTTETPIPIIKDDLQNSIQPSISECERFICYLNKRFDLGLSDNLIVNIESTHKTTMGYFRSKIHKEHYENTTQSLHTIVLSSHFLKETPYETIAHETAHFYNEVKGIKDCTKNQYHNKHFKEVAERLLLKVEKGRRGFADTKESPEFKKMLAEFKPDENAFHIYQLQKQKDEKTANRNLLFMCECGVKVRTARNEDKPFNAVCQYCETPFQQQ